MTSRSFTTAICLGVVDAAAVALRVAPTLLHDAIGGPVTTGAFEYRKVVLDL